MMAIGNFTTIKARELPALVKAFHDGDMEETLKDLEFIDRALTFQKSRALLSRKSPKLKQQLDALLECRVTGKRAVWDSRRRRFVFVDDD